MKLTTRAITKEYDVAKATLDAIKYKYIHALEDEFFDAYVSGDHLFMSRIADYAAENPYYKTRYDQLLNIRRCPEPLKFSIDYAEKRKELMI
jgi:DNA-binding GntR family transcriptional regulator